MDKKKIKQFIMKNQMNLIIAGISLISFIIGILAIGFLKSFLIIGFIDLLLFAPNIINLLKKKGILKIPKKGLVSKKVTSNQTKKETVIKKEKKKKPIKEKKEKKNKKKRKIWKKILIGFLILCIILFIAGCVAVGLFFKQIAEEAPEFDPNKLDRQESSIFYSASGEEIAKVGTEKREKITYDQMSEVLINAIIATEDSRYFKHNGFDLARFLKASIQQVLGKPAGGASTITMQVSKNNYTSREAEGWEGIKRKFTDIYMAMFQLEKRYSKEEILEFYINDNYMGGGSYGVEQACLTYFGKHAKDLNLAEAAMIAGLFQSPGGYDPFVYPEACERRRKIVLSLMERHGYITAEERKAASLMTVDKILKPSTETSDTNNEYMSFINLVMEQLRDDFGLNPYTTPVKVYTTLNTGKQDEINKILTGETYNWQNPAVDAGVAMIDTKSGAILAISGGRHHMYDAKVNNYATIPHQIGSTAKPLFDYGPAIEYLNWSTGQLIVDEKHSYTGSSGNVNNWDLKYMGMMTIGDALRMSRNIPALKTFQELDSKDIATFTSNLHLSPEIKDGVIHEAHSIGGYNGESPLSLAAAYNAFANGGYYITPHSYTKIEYRDSGEIVEKKIEKTRAMSEETAYMVMDMLVKTPPYALGVFSSIPGVTYGAKTGTTNYDTATFNSWGLPNGTVNDFWVVGSSPDYTLSLWYGYDHLIRENVDAGYVNKVTDYQHTKLFQLLGRTLFEKGTSFTKPDGVISVSIEKESYPLALPSENTPSDMITTALFKKGTEPTEVSPRYMSLSDVTNLKGSASSNKVTLTWNAITPPTTHTEEGLRSIYKDLIKTDNYFNSYIGSRISYNKSVMGDIEYHIYRKNENGNLTFIDKTGDSKITFTEKNKGNNTYVVKTSYSIFTKASSGGIETKVTVEGSNNENNENNGNNNNNNQTPEISILLNGKKNIKISEKNPLDETGTTYVMVTEREDGLLVDVTKQAKITLLHEKIDYTKIGEIYPIAIKVTYKDVTKTLELNATIE